MSDRLNISAGEDLNVVELQRDLLSLIAQFPSEPDVSDALESFALLQRTYNLKTEDLSDGYIKVNLTMEDGETLYPPQKADFELNALNMRDIGISSIKREWYDLGVEWLEYSLAKWQNSTEHNFMFSVTAKELKNAKMVHDQLLEKRGPVGRGNFRHRTFTLPFDAKLRKKKKYKEAKSRASKIADASVPILPLNKDPPFNTPLLKNNFASICSSDGTVMRNTTLDSKYQCRYEDHGNPFLQLGPFKLEEIHDQPLIVIFRDFFSRKETGLYKRTIGSTLQRSSIGSAISGNHKPTSKIRTSKTGWIEGHGFRFPVTDSYLGYDGQGNFGLSEDMEYHHVPPFTHHGKHEIVFCAVLPFSK